MDWIVLRRSIEAQNSHEEYLVLTEIFIRKYFFLTETPLRNI